MTAERAREIIQRAQAHPRTGGVPWVDCLVHVMQPGESEEVKAVWATMPGEACFLDALKQIALDGRRPVLESELLAQDEGWF